jgi:hypothetical protein
LPLAPDQVGNATRDLLALTATPTVQGFGQSATVDPLAVIDSGYLFALYQTAGGIATQVASRASALAACAAGDTDAACATRFGQTFGRKTFRRALDDAEVGDLMKVFATVCPGPSPSCASPADFAAAITLMTKALILAPSFLYRSELGPRTLTANAAGIYPDTTLTADEVATQLGFMFLDSTPDDGLLGAAASGSLATPAGILSEVERLLALPVTQAHVADLVSAWVGANNLAERTKDAGLLSALPSGSQDQAAIAAELKTSLDLFIVNTLWASPPGKVTELVTSQRVFVNQRLETLYGLPISATPAATFNDVTWPAAQPRAGILTQPAFLWAVSDPLNASIVKRGKAVHDSIVCQDPVGSEPELTSAEAQAVVATGDSEATRSDARLAAGKLCADNCHSELDPYGRLLHNFDAVGNYRTADEAGRAIDPSAAFTAHSPLGPVTVPGPAAFAQALVSTKAFTDCAVERLFAAEVNVFVAARDTCQVSDLRAAFDRSDGTMSSLLGGIATSDFARARAGGTE